LDDDVVDYLHIEEGKWEIDGHPFDKEPIYDTDKEDEVKVSLPFSKILLLMIQLSITSKERVITLPYKMVLKITYALKKNSGR